MTDEPEQTRPPSRPPRTQNPALALYEILTVWKVTPPQTTVLEHRAPLDWWTVHVAVIDLVVEVEHEVARLAERHGSQVLFADTLDEIKEGVFATNTPMTSGGSGDREHFSDAALITLQLLALTWEQRGMPTAEHSEMLALIDEVDQLIISGTTVNGWSVEEASYLWELASALRNAVSESFFRGGADVEKLANELVGALNERFVDTELHAQAEGLANRVSTVVRNAFWKRAAPALAEAVITQALPPGLVG